MDKRPLTQSMRQWLLDEIELWRSKGFVNEDQAGAILDLYESPRQSSDRQQSIAIYVLVGIAAMFVGLSALLLVGYNWDSLYDPIKLFFLVGAVVGAHGCGFYVRYVWKAKVFSEFAFFLGCLFYGGAIAVIGDMFHLGDHYPDGLWWWALGVLPLALMLDTLLLHLLLTVILAVWVGTEILDFGQREFGMFGLSHACVTLPIFAACALVWAYQKRSPTTVGFYVPLVAWWLVLLPFVWQSHENPIFFIGSVGALLLILAEVHPEESRFAIPYRLYGGLLCMGVLSLLSFHFIHRELGRIQDVGPFIVQSLLITGAAGVAFAWAVWVQSQRTEMHLRPIYTLAVRQWLPLSMVLLMLLMTFYYAALKDPGRNNDMQFALLPTVAANIGMLLLAFWLMMYGLREDRGFPSAGGVIFFLLWSVFRYAEWFGERGKMLGGACMFFFCGASIFAFAMFWHARKKQRAEENHERE
jgi:uncharacterized membrane protein